MVIKLIEVSMIVIIIDHSIIKLVANTDIVTLLNELTGPSFFFEHEVAGWTNIKHIRFHTCDMNCEVLIVISIIIFYFGVNDNDIATKESALPIYFTNGKWIVPISALMYQTNAWNCLISISIFLPFKMFIDILIKLPSQDTIILKLLNLMDEKLAYTFQLYEKDFIFIFLLFMNLFRKYFDRINPFLIFNKHLIFELIESFIFQPLIKVIFEYFCKVLHVRQLGLGLKKMY